MTSDIDHISRRAVLGFGVAAVASSALAAPAIAMNDIPGTRRMRAYHAKTGEKFDEIYYADGEYFPEAMDTLDLLFRDYTANRVIMMDVRLYDLLSAVQTQLETSESIRITSGYRTKKTNDALRRRTSFAARNSLHIQGMAADFTLRGARGSKLAKAAKSLAMGGVGSYRGAEFIHVDVGDVRSWRR